MSSISEARIEIAFEEGTTVSFEADDEFFYITPDDGDPNLKIDSERWTLLQGLRTVLQNGGL